MKYDTLMYYIKNRIFSETHIIAIVYKIKN